MPSAKKTSPTKRTVMIGRFVLETAFVEVEVEDDSFESIEAAALEAECELPEEEWKSRHSHDIPDEPFAITYETNAEIEELNRENPDKPPTTVEQECERYCDEAFAATWCLADMEGAEGRVIDAFWMGDDEKDIMVSDICRDWSDHLKPRARFSHFVDRAICDPQFQCESWINRPGLPPITGPVSKLKSGRHRPASGLAGA